MLTCVSALISNLLISGGNSLSTQTLPAGLLTMAAFLAEFIFSFAHIKKVTVNTRVARVVRSSGVFRALFEQSYLKESVLNNGKRFIKVIADGLYMKK